MWASSCQVTPTLIIPSFVGFLDHFHLLHCGSDSYRQTHTSLLNVGDGEERSFVLKRGPNWKVVQVKNTRFLL